MSLLPPTSLTLGLVCLLLSAPADAGLVSTGALFLKPEAGSGLSYGLNQTSANFTHGNEGIFYLDTSFDKGAKVRYNDGNSWSFEFDAPTYNRANNTNAGQQLEVKFYDLVQGNFSNSPTRPGFSINGPSSYYYGGNQSGWFNVLDVAYSATGEIERLAVDFKQFDLPNSSGASNYGSLRLNSTVPLNLTPAAAPVPLPATAWLMACGLGALALRARARRNAA